MALNITGITNVTETSFRITFDQQSPPVGFEDRFYINEDGTSIIVPGDGKRLLAAITTTQTYLDVTGLSAGRYYTIESFRYVDSVYESRASWSHPISGIAYTLPGAQTLALPEETTWVEDWASGPNVRWEPSSVWLWGANWSRIYTRSDGTLNTHVRIGDGSFDFENNGAVILLSKATWDPNYPIDARCLYRRNYGGAGTTNIWSTLTIFANDFHYLGVGNANNAIAPGSFLSWGTHGEIYSASQGTCPLDQIYEVRYTWEPSTNTHRFYGGTPGSPSLLRTVVSTSPLGGYWGKSQRLWLAALLHGPQATLDVGRMEVRGVRSQANASGHGFAYSGAQLTGAGVMAAQEYGGSDNSRFLTEGGGLTVVGTNGTYSQMVVLDSEEFPPDPPKWASGSFSGRTPLLNRQQGLKFTTLKFVARAHSNGSMNVYVRDQNGDLVSDLEIPGNSSGFAADEPATLQTVDLSAVTASGIYLDIQGVHNSAGNYPPTFSYYEVNTDVAETSTGDMSGGGSLVAAGIAGFLALATAALPALSAVATSEHYNRASIAATIPAQTASVTAVRGATASGASALSPFTASVTGRVGRTGVAAATLNPFTASAGGTVVLAGYGSAIVAVQTASVTGAVGKNIDGEATVPAIVGSAIGDFAPLGEYIATGSATMPACTASGTDYGIWYAAGASSIPASTGVGVSASGANATVASTLPVISASSSAAYTADVTGAAAIPSATGTGTGIRGQVLSGSAAITSPTGTASGDFFVLGEIEGVVGATLPSIIADVSCEADISGVGAASIQAMVASGWDIEASSGIGAATAPTFVASVSGGIRTHGRGRGHGKGGVSSKRDSSNVVSPWRYTQKKTNSNRGR